MNPDLSIKLENKVAAIMECNYQLKNRGIPLEDTTYTSKMKTQYLGELAILLQKHPELAHHPALMKLKTDIPSVFLS